MTKRNLITSTRPTCKPVTTRINALLKKLGREERFVRGRGYYYLRHTHHSSMLCVYWLDPTEADFQLARDHVNEFFKLNHIEAAI